VSSTSTNDVKKKPGEEEKPVEIVFVIDKDVVRARPVKRGISDDSYMEITDGLGENDEVVSGGYKAIARELEDGKAIVIGTASLEPEAKK
jgi:HlyD family secretion protein